MTGALILIAAFLVQPAPAGAETIPPCPAPDNVQLRSFPKDIPQSLLSALEGQYGTFAGPGEAFNSSDVVFSGAPPQRRIVFAWQKGSRWVFATEHGGIGYNNPVIAYELTPRSRKPVFLNEDTVSPPTLCGTARKRIADGR